MATAKITLTYSTESNGDTSAKIKITMKYYGNGISFNNEPCTGTITFNGTTKSFTHTFTTSTSAQTMGSAEFTVTKTHSSQTLEASGRFNTGVSIGTLRDTCDVSISAKTHYTIKYSANGGSGAPSSQTKWHGESLTLSKTNPTRTGYSFKNWKGSNGDTYASGATTNYNGNLTLTAQWEAQKYTLTFNANGGNVSTSTKTVTYNSKYGTLPTPTRTGYTFNGWHTSKTEEDEVTSDTICKGNDTVYAHWTERTATLTYRTGAHGTAQAETVTMRYSNKIIARAGFTAAGYVFNGWKDNSTGKTYQPNAIIKNANVVPSAKTLIAQWVQEYVAPTLSDLSIIRGEEQDGNFVPLSSGNQVQVSFAWTAGKDTSGTHSTKIDIMIDDNVTPAFSETRAGESGAENFILSDSYEIGNTAKISVKITDTSTSNVVSKEMEIPKGGFPVHISKSGKQIALFGLCDDEPADEEDTLILNGKMQAQGAVFSNNKKLVSASVSSGEGTKVVPNGTELTPLATIENLSAGTYLLIGLARFESNSNGRRGLAWGSENYNYFNHSLIVVAPVNGAITRVQSTAIMTITESTQPMTIYLKGYHTAGANVQLSVPYYWRYIKLA